MERNTGLLSGCRVLDLTDEKGFLCGRTLADLGADVIKIEPPGGSPSRNIGPFYHDEPDPQKSLYWLAYNANKRGITLALEAAGGADVFRKLVAGADMVVESFPVGFPDRLGLGYRTVAAVNPRIVMVSISPFGQTGPYRHWQAPDIVSVAMAGEMYVTGDPDRPPLRIGLPQAYLHAGGTAAVASLIAYTYARSTGIGQHVDVSICESLLAFSATVAPFWYMLKQNLTRQGVYREGAAGNSKVRLLWPCKDGYVVFSIMGTPTGAKTNSRIMQLMERDSLAGPLKSINWDGFDRRTATQEFQSYVEEAVAPFVLRHTKDELLTSAIDNGIMMLPVYTPSELSGYPQLKAREYWRAVEHPELEATLHYPGDFVKCAVAPCGVRRRAPLVGEHNEEIYIGELGFTRGRLVSMAEMGIV